MTTWRLSPEQRAIVDHPLTPLRIAAGAGTGKTATIVLRLAAAIADGIAPEAALGITFTNKAAEELADRLRLELPVFAAEGREVEVTTYHGFAYSLLQDFGALVGVERSAQVISSGYQRQLLTEALAAGSYEHLDLTAPDHRVDEAATLARQLGDNLLTPTDVVALAQPSDVWAGRRELAAVLERYVAEKRRLGVVDYADLIRLAHRLVTDHPEIMRRIRERYRIVIVDEYQDTDPGQRLLLQALFGNGFPIVAVGDPDQTIYEWRGASVANFAEFPTHFPADTGTPAPTMPLTLNRRSATAVIDVANAVRTRLHDAFDPLQALPDADPGLVTAGWFRTTADEAGWIADEIASLHDDGLAWSEIAVLFRKNRDIAAVRDALHALEIPTDVVSLGGLLAVPEVAELLAWLRILDDPEDAPALARILLGGKYRLGLGDLAPLQRWARTAAGEALSEEGPLPLLEAIDRLDDVPDLAPEAEQRLRRFAAGYRELLVAAQGVSLAELCRLVLDRIDAWAEIDALPRHAALSVRLNVYRFLDRAESWSPLEGRPSLRSFLDYLAVLEREPAAEELDTAAPASDEAVTLMTVHRAKGLEWNTVFLPAVTAGAFPSTSRGYDNPVKYAKFLPYEFRIDAGHLPDLDGRTETEQRDALADHHLAQEWRTAYVAVTRSKQRLSVTGAFWNGVVKPRAPSALWDLCAEAPGTVVGPRCADPGAHPEDLPQPPTVPAPDPLFTDDGWQTALRSAHERPGWVSDHYPELADMVDEERRQLELTLSGLPEPVSPPEDDLVRTSVTGLVTLAGCPLRFRWAEVDRLPRRPDRSRQYGTDFHRKAELHNLGIVPLDDVTPEMYDLDEGERGAAVAGTFDRFRSSRFGTVSPRFVEVPIEIVLEGARIRGRVDAVYESADAWEIVDYKSGRQREDPNRLVQLQAYAVAAVDGAIADRLPDRLRVTFAYFGGGTTAESTWEADETFVARARATIAGLVEMATTAKYPPTPSPACRSCDFIRFCDGGRAWVAAHR